MKTSQWVLSLCVVVSSSLASAQALQKRDFGFHYQFSPIDSESLKYPLKVQEVATKDGKKVSSKPVPLATVSEERNTAPSQAALNANPYHRTLRTGFLSF
jgi:hypothetical protein